MGSEAYTANPEYVTVTQDAGVVTFELGRSPAHALSRSMIGALQKVFNAAALDPDCKVVVLVGAGRIFCAGHDMKEIRAHREDEDNGRAFLTNLFTECATLMECIATFAKPTIGVCEGVATAGGLQLLSSCDLVFAAPSATFALPGVINGGFCTTPSVAVSRRIAPSAVLEMSYSGDVFDADWALRTGLINRIVPQNNLRSTADDFARTLATRHMPAVEAGKATLLHHLGQPLSEAYAQATPVMLDHFMDPHRIAKDKDRW